MSYLDALLGRILSAGIELELQGGLNFKDGVRAVPNTANKLIDVSMSGPRILGVALLRSSDSQLVDLTADQYDSFENAFTMPINISSVFALESSGCAAAYSGANATVLAFATLSAECASASKTCGFQYAVDDVQSGSIKQFEQAIYGVIAHIEAFEMSSGEVLELKVTNYTDNSDITISGVSLLLVAIAEAS